MQGLKWLLVSLNRPNRLTIYHETPAINSPNHFKKIWTFSGELKIWILIKSLGEELIRKGKIPTMISLKTLLSGIQSLTSLIKFLFQRWNQHRQLLIIIQIHIWMTTSSDPPNRNHQADQISCSWMTILRLYSESIRVPSPLFQSS